MFVHYLVIALVVLAMLSIVLEEWIHINKAKTTLFFGCTAWVVLFMHAHAGAETDHYRQYLAAQISLFSVASIMASLNLG